MGKIRFFLFLGLFSGAVFPHERVDSLKIKVYRFAVSKSPLCTEPIIVFSNDNPKEVDLFDTPDFGSGPLALGSYPCIMIEMSDTVKFMPLTPEGVCLVGKEYTYDICGKDRDLTFRLINGTQGKCARGEQRIAVYLSTASTLTRMEVLQKQNGYLPPGWNLQNPLVIDNSTEGYFLLDGNFQVVSRDKECILEMPQFSFRQAP